MRKWSKSKLVALAKYYFLRALVETDSTNEGQQVLRMPISKTFKDDLAAICRDLKEANEIKKEAVLESKPRRRRNGPLFVAENESSSSERDLAEEGTDASSTTITGLPESQVQASQQDTIQSLLELSRDQSSIESDTVKIQQNILTLQTRREILVQEEADRLKRMADMLEGMSAGAAFMMGRQVEREMANKRRRRE